MADDRQAEDTALGIGAFARLSSISIPRLRRYHEAGLLEPAEVDPTTGYRTYTSAQLAKARAIGRLRLADLPLDELRVALADDTTARLGAFKGHRRRLKQRLAATERMIELVDQLIREERTNMANASLQLMEVAIRVEDVEGTIAFYREVLGFDFQASDHEGAPLHYNASGGTWDPEGFFLFTIFHADRWSTRAEIGFEVHNVDEVWEKANSYDGAQITAPKDVGHIPRHAVICDPAGNRINLYQRVDDR
jgi:DNA-binding transcriptional MerR regulator